MRSCLTIAGNDEKLVIVSGLVHSHIRKGGNNLLFWRQICALLELKVADSSAERKVAIDSAKVDEATGCDDSCLLSLILRLVIE